MRPDAVCAAAGRRFPWLPRLTASPVARRLWRLMVWGFWLIYFGFVTLVLALRYSILPNIEQHRPDIERFVSQGLGQAVSIGRIEASWEGINPDLTLFDVQVHDAAGRPALAFSRVEAILSWWSVPNAKARLRLLRIDQPTLHLRRDREGHFFIAGIPLSGGEGDSDVSDWIFGLRRVRIHNATLIWEDEQRQAPVLRLESLNFALDNFGRTHRFGLTARPPAEFASPIDVRGDFRGSDIDSRGDWSGNAFAEIDEIDLAVWRQWIDYPFALPHGRGALRAWIGVADGALREMTLDLSLVDANLRLARHLPSLDLARLSGRIAASFSEKGFVVNGRQVALETRSEPRAKGEASEAIRIEPTDFHAEWQPGKGDGDVSGKASASHLDLSALARLAERLPLDAHTRRLLGDYAPRGRIADLNVRWRGNGERLETYALKARFEDLALRAQGYFPGFSGMSGAIEANEKAGSANLLAQHSSLDLPSVFPVSLIELDSLSARAQWKIDKNGLEAELSRVEFTGPEAAGSAQGVYRNDGSGGPGYIDLTAALTRADARAVWRYMPRAVGDGARYWLRDSILAGKSPEAKLILKGNLDDFPFLDKRKGQFLVTVKAQDVVLDYAKGWPRIDGIHGDLRFEGNGMVVDAHEGLILGAKLAATRAEIPDFDAPISTLLVKGQADGPTSEFLKFIDQSPVADRIDRFTEGMRATGVGHLDLSLKIPLDEKKLAESKIEGIYRFLNNEVLIDSALPPLRQVNGSVQFSGSDLRVPEISANLFGGPLKIKGGLQKDGRVVITANGSINIEQLRKQSDSPVLARLSGTTPYRGEVLINKRNADLVVDSSLVGIASTLPEPFAKNASETLALHFEKKLLTSSPVRQPQKSLAKEEGAVRDQLLASLGQVFSLQMIRRKQASGFVSERAAIGIGQTQTLPESGMSVGVTARQLDLDAWRALFRTKTGSVAEGSVGDSSLGFMPDMVSVKTPDMRLFGRHYLDVDLAASSTPGQWKGRFSSNQMNGDFQWDSAGRGKLTARLKQLRIVSSSEVAEVENGEAVRELPALDIVADEFQLGERHFGRLELQARNEGGTWKLGKVQMSNPHGTLTGSGQWLIGAGRSQTQLDFKVDSQDVGKLLDRLGYPGALRAATGKLEGQLGWKGSPLAFEFSSLNGDMSIESSRGQFVKIDPGAGKLLGLISLQSFPRRIALDFRDIFSEGFAFDSIAAKLSVQNGVMRTDRLQIDGPSARVVMRGEVDLQRETQRLTVNVQPELGSTAALGVALVNPVAGVATLLAHKVLQNPLNQMFGFDYLVTGTWDDPKVEKMTSAAAPLPVPRLPNIPQTGVSNEPSAR